MLRPATAADQRAIHRIVRSAGINPFDLRWERFVVAEFEGRVVGTAQIKTHSDGSRELASIAVVPSRRGTGVARALITALIARERGPLYLFCRRDLEPMYGKFGFRRIGPAEAPPYFARILRVSATLTRLGFARFSLVPIVMKREPDDQGMA